MGSLYHLASWVKGTSDSETKKLILVQTSDHEDNDDIEDLAKIVLSLAITEKVEQHPNRVKS